MSEMNRIGYVNLYRDEDGELHLGATDIYPQPEPEWGEFSDDFVGVGEVFASADPILDPRLAMAREALEQSQALLERMIAWTKGEADFSDGDLATCINTVLGMQAKALEEVK